MQPQDLLTKIICKQTIEKLSDAEFAKKLGLSRPMWTLTKSGKRNIGPTLTSGLVRVYPDLIPDVLAYWQNNNEAKE